MSFMNQMHNAFTNSLAENSTTKKILQLTNFKFEVQT